MGTTIDRPEGTTQPATKPRTERPAAAEPARAGWPDGTKAGDGKPAEPKADGAKAEGKKESGATKVALVGFAAPLAGLVEPALTGDGYAVSKVALDGDTVRTLVRQRPRVIVLDCHPYVETRALFGDVRAAPELAESAVVAVGPPESPEVPGLEVVRQPGRSLELDRLLQAVNRASGRYAG